MKTAVTLVHHRATYTVPGVGQRVINIVVGRRYMERQFQPGVLHPHGVRVFDRGERSIGEARSWARVHGEVVAEVTADTVDWGELPPSDEGHNMMLSLADDLVRRATRFSAGREVFQSLASASGQP